MDERDIDQILENAANDRELDPAVLGRVSRSMAASLRPVRPIAPPWALASALVLISAAIAAASAWLLGFSGIRNLNGAEIATIFSALAIFTFLVATISASEIVPGSRRWIQPARLLLLVMV